MALVDFVNEQVNSKPSLEDTGKEQTTGFWNIYGVNRLFWQICLGKLSRKMLTGIFFFYEYAGNIENVKFSS